MSHDDNLSRKQLIRLLNEYRVFDSVLQTTDVMLVLLDSAFNFVWVNDAYAATCQMTRAEMIGKNHFVLYPHADNETIFRRVRDRGEAIFYKDRPFVFPDQPERGITYWDWSLKPVKDDEGTVTGLVFSLRETTQFQQAEAALRENEERLRLAWQATRDVIWDWDVVHDTQRWNAAGADVFGWRDAVDAPQSAAWWLERVHPDDRVRVTADFHAILEDPARDRWEDEYRFQHTDGDYLQVLDRGFILRDNQGKPRRMIGAMQDITARKQAELALRQSETRYRMLHESLRDAFVQTSMEGHIIDCNDFYCQMLGYTPKELDALTYKDLTPERWHDFEETIVQEQILPRGYSDVYEKEYRRKDGTLIPVELRTILARNEAGQPNAMWAIVRDITERKRVETTLHQYATRDWLTGACNRRQFFTVAGEELKRARRLQRPLSLVLIDLDHLKHLNDTYGHAAGDQALRVLTHVCRQHLREIDVFARLGGDEFAVLLPEAPPQQAYDALERIRLTLATQPIELAGGRVAITLSAGIAGLRGEPVSLDALLERADQVLYQTKKAGRNRVGVEAAEGLSERLMPCLVAASEAPPPANDVERRHYPRRAVTCGVQLRVIKNSCPTIAPGHHHAITRDMNECGLQLVVEQPYPVQASLVLAVVDDADGLERLTLQMGTIVWMHNLPSEGRYILGIQFSEREPFRARA